MKFEGSLTLDYNFLGKNQKKIKIYVSILLEKALGCL